MINNSVTKDQLTILLWKNLCIRRCRLCHSIWEIMSGIVIFGTIFLVKKNVLESDNYLKLDETLNKIVYVQKTEYVYNLMASILHKININKKKISDVNKEVLVNNTTWKNITNDMSYLSNKSLEGDIINVINKSNDLTPVEHFIILCTVMAPLPFFLYKVSALVEERRTGLKQLMKLSGVSDNVWRLSHLIDTIAMGSIYAILLTIIFKIPSVPILGKSNFLIVAITILFHFVNISSLSFVTSSISQDHQHAEGWALMVYLLLNLLDTLWFAIEIKSAFQLYVLSWILPHAPMYLFWGEIIALENKGIGLNFFNMWKKHSNDCVPVIVVWFFFGINLVIILLLAWYLDIVRPGKYGVAKDWKFIFGKQFWRQKKRKKKKVAFHVTAERIANVARDVRYFEIPKQNTEIAIKIVNLRKVFRTGINKSKMVEVLNNINLEIYKGEITVLLGPNECGKSSLLSIIAGMYSATSGLVYVNGLDIAARLYEVSKDLGLCPQIHTTFKYLTIEQNVMFFDMLKGTTKQEAKINAQRLMIDLRIDHKANYYSHQLSAGMKGCLQVACALSGGAEVLVLDEPTTGMDYEIKHSLWDVLLLHRGNKTILMSTTCMEEADALGDRIAIMNHGQIRCHGTTAFLKEAIGVGFNLTLVFKKGPDEDAIYDIFVKIPKATIKPLEDKVMRIRLPASEFMRFAEVFDELEARKHELEIHNMCIGMSLEEMYLRFIKHDDLSSASCSHCPNENENPCVLLKGFQLLRQQFLTLMDRNYHFIYTKKIQFFILQLLAPMMGIFFITLSTNRYYHRSDFYHIYFHIKKEIRRQNDNVTTTEIQLPIQERNVIEPKDALLMYLWILYISLLIVLPLVPSIWISINEFKTSARFSHITLGCPAWLHWLCKCLTDYIIFLMIVPPTVLFSCYFLEFDYTLNQVDYLVALLICLVVYGPAFLVHMYCVSFIITNTNSISQIYIMILCFSVMMKLIADLFIYKYYLIVLASLNPIFCFTNLLSIISWVARFNAFCKLNYDLCPHLSWEAEPLFSAELCCDSEPGTSIYSYFPSLFFADVFLLLLGLHIIIYTIILFQLQNRNLFDIFDSLVNTWYKASLPLFKDQNVEYEKYYVSEKIGRLLSKVPRKESRDVLLVSNLHKNYTGLAFATKKCYSVRGVNFSVKKGNCLVLLGTNGAGKSTTLNMIAGNISKSRGTIYANGYFIDKNRRQYLKSLSVSLQRGSLDDFKSAFDNLVFHAKLYGMTPAIANKQAVFWLQYMGITSCANNPVSALSAGSVGRVKLAAVLMTARRLVLLDEPVEVQDVLAKMFVTRALRRALKQKIAVVVATQTMKWKEIEILCDRMAIMCSGELAALGTGEEIKHKYANGYIARIKLKIEPASIIPYEGLRNTGSACLERVKSELLTRVILLKIAFTDAFPNSALLSDHLRMLYYHIKVDPESTHFSEMFGKLQRLMVEFIDILEDYSLNELTLDDILAQFQRPPI